MVKSSTAGDVQGAVAGRAPAAQLVDADALRRDADPGVPLAHVPSVPEGVEVVAGGHVLPLDEHRAVEVVRLDRPTDDHARPVGHVGGELGPRGRVGVGHPREVELLLHVAVPREVLPRREERVRLARGRARPGFRGPRPGSGLRRSARADRRATRQEPRGTRRRRALRRPHAGVCGGFLSTGSHRPPGGRSGSGGGAER